MRSLTQWSADEKHAVIQRCGGDQAHLLNILIEFQRLSGQNYIDPDTAILVAEAVGIGPAQMYEVLQFYAMLETKPTGKIHLEVCNSTPCYYSKSDDVVQMLYAELGIRVGETTPDGLFSLSYTPCVGACAVGPVLKVGDQIYGNLTRERIHRLIDTLRQNTRGEE